jgi:D-lactate dehydrogenase (cytochrome)
VCRFPGWRSAWPKRRRTWNACKLIAPIVGHVGDGNFHVSILVDTADADEMQAAEPPLRAWRSGIRMEGTCTGEHGIGQGKMDYLDGELGPALDVMRWIKKAIDPLNIMNPGKIIRLSPSAGLEIRS